MGILDFEAYELQYLQETKKGFYDDNGDYQPGEEQWQPFGRVNAQPITGPASVNIPDGHTDKFSFSIHIHNPRCREFRHGEKIRLTNPFGEEYLLTVKGFARHQNKCIIQT